MKSKKSRVVAKIFLVLTILAALVLAAAGVYYISLQDWVPYEFTFQLTFDLKHDYLVMGSAGVAILLLITLWSFYLTRNRKKPEKKVQVYEEDTMDDDDWEELTEPAYVACKAPVAAAGENNPKELTRAEKAKKAAKIILPIVGICAAGIAVAVMVKKHRKNK